MEKKDKNKRREKNKMTKTHMKQWDVKIEPCKTLQLLTEGIGDKIRFRHKYQTMGPYRFNMFKSCRTIRILAENPWDVDDIVATYLKPGEKVVFFKEVK